MKIVWDETKRCANLRKYGLDFADAKDVFAGIPYTIEDRRVDYGEQRFITFGSLRDTVVVIAHTETPGRVRIISMRKATRHEQILYFQNI
ncbi:MAG: BrnT family toxin [Betaproteobacteria bacterium]|nr:BrnT family toxin [Betaproteobacteria bacterium]